MSEPVIDALVRFTPESALDRDDLLFRAGRASARTPAVWKWAVGCLAISQGVTLAILFGDLPNPRPSPPHVPVAAERTPDQFGPSGLAEPDSYGVLVRNFDPDSPPKFTTSNGGATGSHSAPLTARWRGNID